MTYALTARATNFCAEIVSFAGGWLATCQPERAECSRSPIVQRYLHGPGTGITNLPSFSATKFSELLDELPLASFVLNLDDELFRSV
jgi:hypothetical protein